MKKNKNVNPAGTALSSQVQRDIREKMQHASILLQSERFAQADYACQEVLKKNPNEAQAWYFRGVIAYKVKKFADAIGFLQETLRITPENLQACRALAGVYMATGDFDAAVRSYGRAIEINPADAGAYYNQGIALDAMAYYEASVKAYMQALKVQSDHWKASFNCALALQKLHDHTSAVDAFQRTLQLNPNYVEAHYSLGVSLYHLQRYEEALEAYERVMNTHPNHAHVYNASGFTLAAMGVYQAAVDSYDKALKLNPVMEEAYFNKGMALHQLLKYEEALDCYHKVLIFKSDDGDVYYHCANTLNELKRHQDAIQFYEQAISLGKNTSEVHLNKSIAYAFQGNYERSIEALRDSLVIDPDYAEAYNFLSFIYRQLKKYGQAIKNADQALQLKPIFASAFNNRGLALQAIGDYGAAVESFDQAIQADDNFTSAYFNKGQVLAQIGQEQDAAAAYAAILDKDPKYPYAQGYLLHTQLRLCQWSDYARQTQAVRQSVQEGLAADTPFSFLSVGTTAAEQWACAKQFTEDKFPVRAPLWQGERYAHTRIRVAYVSADFGEHPTSYLMAGLFEQHDRQHFEIYAFSLRPLPETSMEQRVWLAFDHFIDVSQMDDLQAARLMKTYEIDIAVDLMGYTQHNRAALFTHRAAPVQVNYLGYPGTMGNTCMDYILADEVLIPEADHKYYSEHVVTLPGSFQVNDDQRLAAADVPSRAQCALPEDAIVFCSFNGNHKLNPEFFGVWMRLLRETHGSVLWLVQTNPLAMDNLRRFASRQGIEPQRLVFAPKLPYDQHLARLSLADLVLDSLPFGAGATASDALFAGVPVLTCAGAAFSGRMTASLLHALGLSQFLVTGDIASYETMALGLANNPGDLKSIRQQLAEVRSSSSLFNTERFSRNLEKAYANMQARVNAGLPPEGFTVHEQR